MAAPCPCCTAQTTRRWRPPVSSAAGCQTRRGHSSRARLGRVSPDQGQAAHYPPPLRPPRPPPWLRTPDSAARRQTTVCVGADRGAAAAGWAARCPPSAQAAGAGGHRRRCSRPPAEQPLALLGHRRDRGKAADRVPWPASRSLGALGHRPQTLHQPGWRTATATWRRTAQRARLLDTQQPLTRAARGKSLSSAQEGERLLFCRAFLCAGSDQVLPLRNPVPGRVVCHHGCGAAGRRGRRGASPGASV